MGGFHDRTRPSIVLYDRQAGPARAASRPPGADRRALAPCGRDDPDRATGSISSLPHFAEGAGRACRSRPCSWCMADLGARRLRVPPAASMAHNHGYTALSVNFTARRGPAASSVRATVDGAGADTTSSTRWPSWSAEDRRSQTHRHHGRQLGAMRPLSASPATRSVTPAASTSSARQPRDIAGTIPPY